MTPYYQDERATIYHGDNREILAGMPDNAAFATVTDPPYEVNLNPDTCPWDVWPTDWRQIYRVSAEYLVLSIAPHIAHARIPDVLRAGWNVLEVGAWIYGNGRPVNKTRLKRSYELVYFLSKETREMFVENGRGHYKSGKASGKKNGMVVNRTSGRSLGRALNICRSGYKYVFNKSYHPANVACEIESLAFGNSGYDLIFAIKRVRSIDDDERHPTEKPLALIAQQIKLVSNPGDVILDPFCGSGTTLRAAANSGRVAIGIDKDEAYCELAARRLEEPLLDYGNGRRMAQAGFGF